MHCVSKTITILVANLLRTCYRHGKLGYLYMSRIKIVRRVANKSTTSWQLFPVLYSYIGYREGTGRDHSFPRQIFPDSEEQFTKFRGSPQQIFHTS